MIDTIRPTVSYRAFGFRIESDMALPELLEWQERESSSDGMDTVFVKTADLSADWLSAASPPDPWAVRGPRVMLNIPEVAIFGIEDGRMILYEPCAEADEDRIRLYLLGTCMGALLLQRGMLPLHGSAVALGDRAYAIVGHSGAGKSTLASVLLGRGFRLLGDDVIPLALSAGRRPSVIPAYPQQKLWQDAIDLLGIDRGESRPLFDRENKYAVTLGRGFRDDPLPLAGVFELVADDEATEMEKIVGMRRFHTLYRHTFRPSLIARLGLMAWHFDGLAGFVNRIGMYRIGRPRGGFSAPRLASRIIATINGEEREDG